jgi:hypothetical protein
MHNTQLYAGRTEGETARGFKNENRKDSSGDELRRLRLRSGTRVDLGRSQRLLRKAHPGKRRLGCRGTTKQLNGRMRMVRRRKMKKKNKRKKRGTVNRPRTDTIDRKEGSSSSSSSSSSYFY